MSSVLDIFDTESASARGSWLHLKHPVTGALMFIDAEQKKPLKIKLKGPDSNEWILFMRQGRKDSASDVVDLDAEKDRDAKAYASLTLDMQNIPGVDKNNPDSVTAMYRSHKDIREQAFVHIVNRENFTGAPENG